jgi:hypothetical protein
LPIAIVLIFALSGADPESGKSRGPKEGIRRTLTASAPLLLMMIFAAGSPVARRLRQANRLVVLGVAALPVLLILTVQGSIGDNAAGDWVKGLAMSRSERLFSGDGSAGVPTIVSAGAIVIANIGTLTMAVTGAIVAWRLPRAEDPGGGAA